MQEKFGEKFHIIQPDEYDTIRRITDSNNVYGHFDQVISPMDSIKPLERRAGWSEERIAKHNEERIYSIINSGWDLVVIENIYTPWSCVLKPRKRLALKTSASTV
jgi:hypothetical protein